MHGTEKNLELKAYLLELVAQNGTPLFIIDHEIIRKKL